MRGRPIHFCHSPGVALIVTLMMMSIMVMMVVGLAGVMRNEQAAARNLTYQVAAEQMADLGAREAMALVLSNSTSSIGFPTATGPGWMQVNGPAGKREVDLFSSNSAAQIKWLDRIGTNSLILSLPGAARGLIAACWTNVVTNGGNPNVPFGRYAWWVDDEGSKVNLNATGQNTNYLPFLNAFPIMGGLALCESFHVSDQQCLGLSSECSHCSEKLFAHIGIGQRHESHQSEWRKQHWQQCVSPNQGRCDGMVLER